MRALAFVAAAVGLVLTVPTARAESAAPAAPEFSTAVDVTIASRYLFQGLDYSDGRSVAQPNLAASYGKFSGSLWANYQSNLGDVNEVDAAVKYTHAFGPVSVSPGYMMLRFPNRDWDPSQEATLDLAAATPANPTLSLHYDFDAGTGLYATLGVSHDLRGPLTLGANLFYQSSYYDMTGVPSVEIRAGTSLPFGSFLLTPVVSRFLTHSNGDFRGDARLPQSWLIAINVVPNEK